MTFTATPQPSNTPPRVLLDVNSDVSGSTFTTLTITRNGDPILTQPPTGAQTASTFDYLAPFDQSVEYIADGTYLPFVTPFWTETWPNLASWTGDTGSWSVAAGVASSSTANAAITRTTGGTVQRVNVTNPSYVRLEILTAADVVVCSVAVTSSVVLTGTSSVAVAGTGSFELNLTGGTATVTGTAGWTATRPYTGVPSKVRFVSLGGTYTETSSFSTTGNANNIARHSGGNIYALDITAKLVRKFNSAGVLQTSWSTTDTPTGIAVDSGEAVYVTCQGTKLVRKYTSTGTAGITWSTTGEPYDIGTDGTALYVLDWDNDTVRKYTNAGAVTTSWAVESGSEVISVASDGTVVVIDDTGFLERYNSTGGAPGSGSTSFSIGAGVPRAAAQDGSNFIYVSRGTSILKFSPSGVDSGTTTIAPNTVGGVGLAGSTLLIGDLTAKTIRSFGPTTGSVGTVVATPVGTTIAYRETVLATLNVDEAWLLHPAFPSLSVSIDPGPNAWRGDGLNVNIASAQQAVGKSSQTVHYPIGRARGVAISHGNRLDDEWTLVLTAPRLEDRDSVSAITRDQTPLLLRSPEDFGWDLPDGYYAVGDVESTRPFAPLSFVERILSLPLTPSDPPVVRQETERTYATLLLEAASYSELLSLYDTYTDLASGTT